MNCPKASTLQNHYPTAVLRNILPAWFPGHLPCPRKIRSTLPDLDTADVQETTQEEYCENCGRVMVFEAWTLAGQFMACTALSRLQDDPPPRSGKKVPDIPIDELCPKCGRNMMIRHGRFGEFTACSGYPECKYVKQNFIGVKCPLCKMANRREEAAQRDTFYGCGNTPSAKFTSAGKPLAEKCPSCGSDIWWRKC